ncbi:bcl-2-binding component 3 [Gastrophryne carolinensis]
MARALHDSSNSEPVGNIQAEANRTFPANAGACGAHSRICEQNLPLSHPTAPSPQNPPAMCQRCSSCQTPSQDRQVTSYESGSSSTTCEHRLCRYPEPFSTGETTAYGLRHTTNEHSSTGTEVEVLNQDEPQAELAPAGDVPVEREIALRLRRIGDQMNERYLRRRQVAQRQWWGPLRWHLTQMISEILAALYNPLVDILPQN